MGLGGFGGKKELWGEEKGGIEGPSFEHARFLELSEEGMKGGGKLSGGKVWYRGGRRRGLRTTRAVGTRKEGKPEEMTNS